VVVLGKYKRSWGYLKDGVSVEEAEKQLDKFFMGRHLPHAPTDYLKNMVFANLLVMWKEMDEDGKNYKVVDIPYEYHGLRGMNCFACYVFLYVKEA